MKLDYYDLAVRFLAGGSAVAASYLVSLIVPWTSFSGIFAAFPAVMAAALILTGCKQGSRAAADVAFGAVAGMLGCTFCVVAAIVFINLCNSWPLGLLISLIVWLAASALCFALMDRLKEKLKKEKMAE